MATDRLIGRIQKYHCGDKEIITGIPQTSGLDEGTKA